jgi:chemotaxis protein CheD
MRDLVVGVSDCRVSNDPNERLITYALGSCIAVAIYDPIARVGGLLHYLLPDSKIDGDKAKANPYMFADTGIPALFHSAYTLGASKKRLSVFIAGGAQVFASELFQVGKRNQLAMKKIMWRAGVLIEREEVGGDSSRTIYLGVDTGEVFMKIAGSATSELLNIKRCVQQKERLHSA